MPQNGTDKANDFGLDTSDQAPASWGVLVNGCGYLVFVFLVTTAMLIVNAIVCLSIHSAVMSFSPDFFQDQATFGPHIGQLFFFIVPVLLTIIQWNLIDRLNRIFRG